MTATGMIHSRRRDFFGAAGGAAAGGMARTYGIGAATGYGGGTG
ncbi:hypothetical protein [Gordonia sp. (in: high G+C Gram-positive bacteria)]|nr:hypothetical protein [Gordonia sp. (in: high G+C Gram-positive bacteria)]